MNYKIAAYDVEFPHKAYGVQLGFMEKVLKALDGKTNALLEAPTGSGKTLSLLCAALAWQRQQRNVACQVKEEAPVSEGATGGVEQPTNANAPDNLHANNKSKQKTTVPKIYYATRTHSQIAQVLFQLQVAVNDTVPNRLTQTRGPRHQVVRELKRTAYRPKMAILVRFAATLLNVLLRMLMHGRNS